jgi:Flp pilus assembly protein TadB
VSGERRDVRPSGSSAAGAGFLILSVWALSAGIGAAIGALVGALVPLLVAGVFVGFGLGIAVVIRRFRYL